MPVLNDRDWIAARLGPGEQVNRKNAVKARVDSRRMVKILSNVLATIWFEPSRVPPAPLFPTPQWQPRFAFD